MQCSCCVHLFPPLHQKNCYILYGHALIYPDHTHIVAVLQAELLQSQGEVRMLLDRVSESSRDRAEMVSSRVHTQLMAIADEKAMASERRGQIMEREVCLVG